MRTISIRFSEKFSPEIGTIKAHQELIDEYGFCWYGKLGSRVSERVIQEIMKNEDPRILLIHSGKTDRYWLHISEISRERPDRKYIPSYYRDMEGFSTWFKVRNFESAESNVISKCTVASSGTPLGEASRHSMTPYFIIDADV